MFARSRPPLATAIVALLVIGAVVGVLSAVLSGVDNAAVGTLGGINPSGSTLWVPGALFGVGLLIVYALFRSAPKWHSLWLVPAGALSYIGAYIGSFVIGAVVYVPVSIICAAVFGASGRAITDTAPAFCSLQGDGGWGPVIPPAAAPIAAALAGYLSTWVLLAMVESICGTRYPKWTMRWAPIVSGVLLAGGSIPFMLHMPYALALLIAGWQLVMMPLIGYVLVMPSAADSSGMPASQGRSDAP